MQWLTEGTNAAAILAGLAALTWVLTLLLVPWFIARLPADYFQQSQRRPVYTDSLHPLVGWGLATLKNIIGAALILLGLIMLFTPGQGLATVLVGLMLLNFPGKYRLEQRMAQNPRILRSLNWLRDKMGRAPLLSPVLNAGKEEGPVS